MHGQCLILYDNILFLFRQNVIEQNLNLQVRKSPAYFRPDPPPPYTHSYSRVTPITQAVHL